MTSVKPRFERSPEAAQVPEGTRASRRRSRTLLALMVVLALSAAAMAAWIVFDRDSATALPVEVEQTIDEFIVAMEAGDEAALRAVVNDDFRRTLHTFKHGIGSQAGKILLHDRRSDNVVGVAASGLTDEFQIERIGDPIVSGDRPWFVSVEENATKCSYRDTETGECSAFVTWTGTATYTVVEEQGVYQIADKVWVGLAEW